MEFLLDHLIDDETESAIAHEIKRVDPDAGITINRTTNRVVVDSWLFPEEFLVAFDDAGYNVRILDS
ncbi:hypothetical protein DIE15_12170 [Burkholderia sp. Bp9031]|uniref:hypothetical protein n=1 Tax=Burkholderia sp. Bp9031 TaxID=2184566 RepID=UPI000F6007B7|nr:hypothetical protein [Burkholderia sp. Bp9031]RQZ17223.1 hypothetical protein DIE15_12170 [Burkholderia sp. Bp9031]